MKDFISKLKNAPNFRMIGEMTKGRIDESQKELGVNFSKDYYTYLQNCGCASFNGHELTGICNIPRLNVVDVTIGEMSSNPQISQNLYFVEQANIDGMVIWQSASGEIYQSLPGKELIKIANSLSDYIDQCV